MTGLLQDRIAKMDREIEEAIHSNTVVDHYLKIWLELEDVYCNCAAADACTGHCRNAINAGRAA